MPKMKLGTCKDVRIRMKNGRTRRQRGCYEKIGGKAQFRFIPNSSKRGARR